MRSSTIMPEKMFYK